MSELVEIQRLQFRDLAAAEDRARAWLRGACGLDVERLTLRPKPTSLNSFNGVAEVDGRELFFKSHIDPDGAVSEYYNSQVLAEAGYHVLRPVLTHREPGQQIVFYPVVTEPVLFDLARAVERDGAPAGPVVAAERSDCVRLTEIYAATAERTPAAAHRGAPVHQLFWHRLTGGRYAAFYGGADIGRPDGGGALPYAELADRRWTVNGVEQPRTLRELVTEAARVLDPDQDGPTVIGHGDAHYGNVFLDGDRFLYFDPAFAGRHSPVLDLAKPLFHNVFAQWMYFPVEKAAEIPVTVRPAGDRVEVEYAGAFPPVRAELLRTKLTTLVEPVLGGLADAGLLPYGRRALHLALLCCPLLTMNLADAERFPAAAAWLGLALAVQLGNWDVEQDFALG